MPATMFIVAYAAPNLLYEREAPTTTPELKRALQEGWVIERAHDRLYTVSGPRIRLP